MIKKVKHKMNLGHKYFLVIVCCLSSTIVLSQEQLTLTQAIDIALKNNYDIQIVKNNEAIAANNNSLGNAGMLPRVDVQASTSLANNATKQVFSSGLIVDKPGVQSQNLNAGVYLTWTLFDGFKMFATHERLKELEAMGILSTKIQIENTLQQLIVMYYNIVRQKQLIKGLSENISISEERLKIAQKKMEIGSASKLDVLQAKVDMNAQTSNLYRQKTTLTQLKISLNQLLVRSVETEFDVEELIPVEFQLKYDELKNTVNNNNVDLMYAQRTINLYSHLIRETKSQIFPRLNLNTNYLFSRSENQAGFALLNQNLGLNVGLTASWNIFNGFNTSNQIKNARLQLENANLEYNNIKTQLQLQLLSAFKNYQDDAEILKLEEENTTLAKEAVDIALERFKVGSSNAIELKEIQKSYDDALTRLADARYTAKVSETQLMKLNGALLK
jgi:outer membrane protein